MKNKEYLLNIIDKLINGNINSDENLELMNFYQNFQSEEDWSNELGSEIKMKNKIQSRILKSIHKKKSTRVIKLSRVLGYAASILILVSVSTYVFQNNFSQEAVTKKAVKVIKPGTQKATLILGDGTKIDLEKEEGSVIRSNNNTRIVNRNKKLSYVALNNNNTGESLVYNTLIVPVGGMYQVVLPDSTKVWLNSKSVLKYPIKFVKNERRVELSGEAYFEVTKSDKQFIVETQQTAITVLGTHFNVSSYTDDDFFATTLVEGKVSLTNKNHSLILNPGEQGYLTSKNSNLKSKKVDTEIYTAWTKGKFYFEKQELRNIMAKMSRWYNVEYKFIDKTVGKELFTGVVMKSEGIDNLLDKLSLTTNIGYHIKKVNEKYIVEIRRK